MIHILHTPAATLVRRRISLLARCATAVAVMGSAIAFHAFHVRLPRAGANTHCDFIGTEFLPMPQNQPPLPASQPTRIRIPQLQAPDLPELPAASAEWCTVCPDTVAELNAGETEVDNLDEVPLPPQENTIPLPRRTPARTMVADTCYTPPAYLHTPPPPYPPRLRQRGAQGEVHVLISVSPQGVPTEVTVTRSSGYAALDSHACNWIMRHWRFSPAKQGTIMLASQVRTHVAFSLYS